MLGLPTLEVVEEQDAVGRREFTLWARFPRDDKKPSTPGILEI